MRRWKRRWKSPAAISGSCSGLELHTSDDPASAKDGDIVLKLDDAERDTLGRGRVPYGRRRVRPDHRRAEPQGLFYGLITAVQSLSAGRASYPSAGRGTTPIIPSAAG